MVIRNLTPHAINIVSPEGEAINSYAPSGVVARCSTSTQPAGQLDDGTPLTTSVMGEVEGLPDEDPNFLLIVSRIVAAAAPGRKDLVVPGQLVRNEKGVPIGATSLERV